MPFDAITMAAVADEVEAAASSGRIQRILQPSPFAVALAAYTGGAQFWLVLSADPEHARAHMTREKQIKAFATPSAFVMLLRKYLEGARLLGATATRGERILTVRCRGANEIRLIAEVMGRHSNVILVDADDTILGAVKGVSPRQSSVRPIAPGLLYHTPPEQGRDTVIFPPGGRVDPYRSPGNFESLLGDVPASVPLRTALQGLLLGSNPFLVGQIIQRAGLPADKEVGRAAIAAVLAAGAAGVRMGTRFIAAEESNAHPDYVKAVIAARAEDRVRTNKFHVECPLCPSTHGVLRQAIEAADAFQGDYVAEIEFDGERQQIARFRGIPPFKGFHGHIEAMACYAGQSVGDVKRVQPAAEIVAELIHDAERFLHHSYVTA